MAKAISFHSMPEVLWPWPLCHSGHSCGATTDISRHKITSMH